MLNMLYDVLVVVRHIGIEKMELSEIYQTIQSILQDIANSPNGMSTGEIVRKYEDKTAVFNDERCFLSAGLGFLHGTT